LLALLWYHYLNQSELAEDFVKRLENKGIVAAAFGPQQVRFVTHMDFTEEMMQEVIVCLKDVDSFS